MISPPGPPNLGGEAPLVFSQLLDADAINGLWPTKSLKVIRGQMYG
jgi:hypothetical protein